VAQVAAANAVASSGAPLARLCDLVERGETMAQTQTAREQQSDYIWGRGEDELDRLIAPGRRRCSLRCSVP
jgi:hypothetical protein